MKNQLIYIIESDPNFAQELFNIIEQHGNFKVNIFQSVETAMIYAEIEAPVLVFFESIMASTTDVNAINSWKNKFQDTKLVIIGNNKDIKVLQSAYSNGVSKFILNDKDLSLSIKETLNLIHQKSSKFWKLWGKSVG